MRAEERAQWNSVLAELKQVLKAKFGTQVCFPILKDDHRKLESVSGSEYVHVHIGTVNQLRYSQ
jgi:Mor family transcriptional regulator